MSLHPSPARFLALGDSYTIGEGVLEVDRWPVVLARTLSEEGIPVAPPRIIAKTGWTTSELLEGMEADPPEGTYDLVTLLIGVNNQYRGLEETDFAFELGHLVREAVRLAGGRPGRVLLLSIPDWGVTTFASGLDRDRIARKIYAFNEVIMEAAERQGCRYADVTMLSQAMGDAPDMLAGDGLHPSGAQYARWAQSLLPLVRRMLTESLGA
jgi:lysophospholipase L1-like esterase